MSRKKILVAAIGLAIVVAAAVASLFLMGRSASETAEDFLLLIAKGQIEEAYQMTAPDLRAKQNLDTFERRVDDSGLSDFASVSWSKQEEGPAEAKFEGTVTTKAGEKFPLRMTLIRIEDSWRVLEFEPPA